MTGNRLPATPASVKTFGPQEAGNEGPESLSGHPFPPEAS
ncbi:hypothetical protein HMPREF3039_02828 [Akkermansia sp. KLE1798]|nr:hypothetical protein HMPREF3039_02828 [Akkermansia sp. KLE1798]KZA03709.1 hypothetical protein HMPREF1326_02686 [Akkermansia sp. KLE1605]